jgi:hypothetical protein
VDVRENSLVGDGQPGGRSVGGGGVRNQGTLTWRLGSLVGNTARAVDSSAFGGGLLNDSGASAALDGLIVTGNVAGDGPASTGGGIDDGNIPGHVTLHATLVLGNAPNDCSPPVGACH